MTGKKVLNYHLVSLLGEGGMASVYQAEHEMLGTKVAIKILNPVLSGSNQIRERFKNEARLMASLDHPNITKVIDFDEQPSQLSIVMEFLSGHDLGDMIRNHGPMSDKQIEGIFSQILSAFQYAHEKGIVHRDIKPSNIYLLPDGRVKILDFGIAKLFGQGNEMTQTGTQIGTPVFMSPEQVKGDKSIDHRSDIYSLGVTLYFMVNGKPPYDVEKESQFDVFNKIVFENITNVNAQSKFGNIVMKACAKDRNLRFQSCEEWLDMLGQGIKKNGSRIEPNTIDTLYQDNIRFDGVSTDTALDPTLQLKGNRVVPVIALVAAAIVVFVTVILVWKGRDYPKDETSRLVDSINHADSIVKSVSEEEDLAPRKQDTVAKRDVMIKSDSNGSKKQRTPRAAAK